MARAREQHLGQFFTPESVVRFVWRVMGLLDDQTAGLGKLNIFDSSFGSGRMFAPADPRRHRLVGIEVDRDLAEQVQEQVKLAGFERQLEIGSMEEFRYNGFEFEYGLLNPPFSITIDTPMVEPYACNAYGRFGARSSALSHAYAVMQALKWCERVAAVVPLSFARHVLGDGADVFGKRLVAVYQLPRATFRSEGAEVDVAVCVWGDHREGVDGVKLERVRNLDQAKPLFEPHPRWRSGTVLLTRATEESDAPTITLPATGDSTVRIVHDGRKLRLRFACGYIQGRVMNQLLRDRVTGNGRIEKCIRLAKGVEYSGQGWLDLENYLAQRDPLASMDEFAALIRSAGGSPVFDPAITRLLTRKARRTEIVREPFRHVVNVRDRGLSRWLDDQDSVAAICRKRTYRRWGGSPVEPGDEVLLKRDTPRSDDPRGTIRWRVHEGAHWGLDVTQKQLRANFDFPDWRPIGNGWTVVHEGLTAAFPADVGATRRRALSLGLDRWCSWTYQFDDLCEVATKRRAIIAWEMGLGKARLAAALCMLGGERNLITVEARLLGEMQDELRKLGAPESDWQIITKPEHARSLRRINVIAYTKLKAKFGKGRKTFADVLRRRIHTHVCDEGHLLRNHATQQTRAVLKVSAKDRYLLSGTPIANYPRDLLPLVQWVGGDGTSTQVYGNHWPLMREQNLRDMSRAPRGVDVFRDMVVSTEWVTNEFADDLRSGAKREIPEIADVRGFRAMVAPFVKRRVAAEPEVAEFVKIPVPTEIVTEIDWDPKHLEFYVETAKSFVEWFKQLYDHQRKGLGLIAVLRKMHAVYCAANFPQGGVAGQPKFRAASTSKQRRAVELLERWASEGHKSIALAQSPAIAEWTASRLEARGVRVVRFHGELPIAKRVRSLDKDFREGDGQVLCATIGCLQTGYNIAQASRVLYYDRNWTPSVERQAGARVLRPQQRNSVEFHFLHLPGSIDEYQAQMVACKAAAMQAGLDYGDDEHTGEGFLHIETILKRFVDDFEARFGKELS